MDEQEASAPLVPVREQVVAFYGDAVPAGELADGAILVPLRPIAAALGLTWSSQYMRVKRHPVLGPAVRSVLMTRTQAGERTLIALPLELVPGWLFGIDAARVRPALREKVLRYQAECFRVLWYAFRGEILPPSPLTTATGAALALEIATAVQALARQQLEMETQLAHKAEQADLEAVRSKQDVMAGYVRGYILEDRQRWQQTAGRLTSLELHLGSGATLSEAQAAEIALAVKAVAAALEAHAVANGYQRVYAELYRRYSISSYKALPAARFAEAMAWLHSWHTELSGPAVPSDPIDDGPPG